MKKATPQNTKW